MIGGPSLLHDRGWGRTEEHGARTMTEPEPTFLRCPERWPARAPPLCPSQTRASRSNRDGEPGRARRRPRRIGASLIRPQAAREPLLTTGAAAHSDLPVALRSPLCEHDSVAAVPRLWGDDLSCARPPEVELTSLDDVLLAQGSAGGAPCLPQYPPLPDRSGPCRAA